MSKATWRGSCFVRAKASDLDVAISLLVESGIITCII